VPNRLAKPRELFNRAAEWDDLAAFTAPGGPDGLRLGVLYGRRRPGRSKILQQLCDATGGLRWTGSAEGWASRAGPGPWSAGGER
jgi:hypothetical protein